MSLTRRIKGTLIDARSRIFKPYVAEIERQQLRLSTLALSQFRSRAQFKRLNGFPIHVVFACHMPALWSMFESIHAQLAVNSAFKVTVVALPYRHSTLPAGQYKDEGIEAFLNGKGVIAKSGLDVQSGRWIDPMTLDPDYLFFQTPYQLFDDMWSVDRVSLFSRVCYVPYATDIFAGGIDETIHPERFFRYVHLFFKEGVLNRDLFLSRFAHGPSWLNRDRIQVTGQPKLDFVASGRAFSSAIWKAEEESCGRRVLWTPRWNTADGVCHFFDYKDFFFEYFAGRRNASLVFRPHPLCLQNFLKTGEMTERQQADLVARYEASPNMVLDRSGGYHDTFMTSDMIVTDLSSMLLEYFATGKPVIYTHREHHFNALGNELAKGCYWVRSQQELRKTLDMLMAGEDPMRDARREIIARAFHFPEGGAGAEIVRVLREDYLTAASSSA